MLNQKVRRIRQLDLLASPKVATAVTKALEEAQVQQAEASSDEDESIEEAVQRLYD
ncbi:hypothetical protein PTT_18030 [Pyrenophora teres f. teres 0-1]|uniref:Uncharacterized protein n=1 Tax=Pyrenophora teres f. teres (strain 0-1) TaxID=861557 RepID=E3S5T1_PYRTT|nr:hypothetical protein PTT_18030 [Pyrenophora teres f. teres 0-1]